MKQMSFIKYSKRQKGQGMSEYLIIVGLVAICAIGVFGFFGETIQNQMAGMAKELSGQSASSEITKAQTAANSAASKAGTNNSLGDYAGQKK